MFTVKCVAILPTGDDGDYLALLQDANTRLMFVTKRPQEYIVGQEYQIELSLKGSK